MPFDSSAIVAIGLRFDLLLECGEACVELGVGLDGPIEGKRNQHIRRNAYPFDGLVIEAEFGDGEVEHISIAAVGKCALAGAEGSRGRHSDQPSSAGLLELVGQGFLSGTDTLVDEHDQGAGIVMRVLLGGRFSMCDFPVSGMDGVSEVR